MPEFRSLASMLSGAPAPVEIAVDVMPLPDAPSACTEQNDNALRDVRLFRAHLREALDRSVAMVLDEIAREVLAREVQLAPPDIERIVESALQRYEHGEPLRVRVHEDAVEGLASLDVPVFSDDSLQRGDAFLDLRNGSIDISLAVRLEDALMRALPQR